MSPQFFSSGASYMNSLQHKCLDDDRLFRLASAASTLIVQLRELNELREQVRNAQSPARSSRRTINRQRAKRVGNSAPAVRRPRSEPEIFRTPASSNW